jgi:hypothetical protein
MDEVIELRRIRVDRDHEDLQVHADTVTLPWNSNLKVVKAIIDIISRVRTFSWLGRDESGREIGGMGI